MSTYGMAGSHYESLDAYTADVEKARNAYAADMAVQDGRCAVCQVNRREASRRARRCGKCEKFRRKEGAR